MTGKDAANGDEPNRTTISPPIFGGEAGKLMRKILRRVIAAIGALAAWTLATVFVILPRMDWSARARPDALETIIARTTIRRWVALNAGDQKSPLLETPENLELGRKDYDEHCAVCHGLDGGGRNSLEADFYPPIPKLIGSTQKMSDAELYFVISNGISLSAMPAFGEHHESEEIWRIVLWVRHLAHLTPGEQSAIRKRMSEEGEEHERTMERSPTEPRAR